MKTFPAPTSKTVSKTRNQCRKQIIVNIPESDRLEVEIEIEKAERKLEIKSEIEEMES
ncbi:hypothetical protein GLU64_02485 [Nanohaloarchaea archaeon]|nr:hypothetical protein [Candidatus Nanohaloarchaea archaeon]